MENVISIYQWLIANYMSIVAVVLGLFSVAEIIVRITPTEKDDGALERVGAFIKKVLDFLKVPNNLK